MKRGLPVCTKQFTNGDPRPQGFKVQTNMYSMLSPDDVWQRVDYGASICRAKCSTI